MALVAPFTPIVLTDAQRRRAMAYLGRSQRQGECLIWGGRKASRGYGAFDVVLSQRPLRRRTYMAHRLVFALRGKALGPYEIVRHTCDNPPCVEESHLATGTQAENMADMDERGRRVSACKLTRRKVLQALALRDRGETYCTIADRLMVSWQAVQLICLGKNWQHVTGLHPEHPWVIAHRSYRGRRSA